MSAAGAAGGASTSKRPAAEAAAEAAAEEDDVSDFKRFCRAWAWKREHRPDKERFDRPYRHSLSVAAAGRGEGARSAGEGHSPAPAQQQQHEQQQQQQQQQPETCTLVIKQRKFGPEGFASTVWDSSIVLSKWAERWAPQLRGKRCLDLSAGCGLVGIVLAKLGADVVATDLAPNLQLLRDNCEANAAGAVSVMEHRWGGDVAPLGPPFDYVFGCDLMYIEEAIPHLVKSLRALATWPCGGGGNNDSRGGGGGGSDSTGGVAAAAAAAAVAAAAAARAFLSRHGRNRGAESAFLRACGGVFAAERVPGAELDPVYQCSDVDVLRLTLVERGGAGAAAE